MLCHGDELGRTQHGNNNAYCQDNDLSWIDWAAADSGLLEFTRIVSALRAAHPVFRRRRFFNGLPVRRRGVEAQSDISWFAPDGTEMTDEGWDAGFGKAIAVHYNGLGIPDRDERNMPITDDSFLLCFNAHHEPVEFTLPPEEFGTEWIPVVDSAAESQTDEGAAVPAGATITLAGRSMVALQTRLPAIGDETHF